MNTLDRWLFALDRFIAVLACIAMVLIVSLEVLFRYCFGRTLMVGIQEIATWTFIWMVAMGCAAMVHRKSHIAVGYFLENFCPVGARKPVEIATNLILMFFFITIIWTGFPFAIEQWSMRTTAANIPKTLPYLSIPVSMVFMLIHTVAATWRALKSPLRCSETPE